MVITRRIIVKRRGGRGAAASPEDKAAFAVTAMLLGHLAGVVADTCLHLAGMRTKLKTPVATALMTIGFLVPAVCGVALHLWLLLG